MALVYVYDCYVFTTLLLTKLRADFLNGKSIRSWRELLAVTLTNDCWNVIHGPYPNSKLFTNDPALEGFNSFSKNSEPHATRYQNTYDVLAPTFFELASSKDLSQRSGAWNQPKTTEDSGAYLSNSKAITRDLSFSNRMRKPMITVGDLVTFATCGTKL